MKTIFICGLGQAEEDFLGVKESSLFFKESSILSFNKQLTKPKKAAKELSEKLSNAKLKMMKHSGHQVNVVHPLELSKMAEKFLENPLSF